MIFRNLYRKAIPKKIRKRIFRYLSAYIQRVVEKKTDKIVMSGPFKGMKLDLDVIPLASLPLSMLLGAFELEIHPAFDKLSVFKFDQIINVGATEGYYAVGMAMKWPQAVIYAFEAEEDLWHPKIAKLAGDNSVADRVHIRGYCRPGDLVDLLKSDRSALLMLDVEGDEFKLLDPLLVNGLFRATIIVELHDAFVKGCSGIIEERFKNTHDISKYVTRPRTLNDFPLRGWGILNPLTGPFIVEAMQERNDSQEFFLMIPKKKINKP